VLKNFTVPVAICMASFRKRSKASMARKTIPRAAYPDLALSWGSPSGADTSQANLERGGI
jgi:hypothetical protein